MKEIEGIYWEIYELKTCSMEGSDFVEQWQ